MLGISKRKQNVNVSLDAFTTDTCVCLYFDVIKTYCTVYYSKYNASLGQFIELNFCFLTCYCHKKQFGRVGYNLRKSNMGGGGGMIEISDHGVRQQYPGMVCKKTKCLSLQIIVLHYMFKVYITSVSVLGYSSVSPLTNAHTTTYFLYTYNCEAS